MSMPELQSTSSLRICSKTVLDSTVPGISFDRNGVCNYIRIYDELFHQYPRGEKGLSDWIKMVSLIKEKGKGGEYDCVIGVSGGTDSCFLLHVAKKVYGLRPLAVNVDNGWNSDISVQNIKKVTKQLDIDLETYVIDYDEVKDILKSYMKAGLPWVDAPTDMAIEATLYLVANKEGIKYIFNGSDFRSEGKQPTEWTYGDAKQLKHIQKTFGSKPIKTFPYTTMLKRFYYGFFRGIKVVRPLYYLSYDKQSAQKMLEQNYGWTYYGGHHHENVFTKFAIAYWLPKKFGIDKRKITLTAQVLNNVITRQQALDTLSKSPYDIAQMERDREFVIKKLGLTQEEFNKIWNGDNRLPFDYPSYFPFLKNMLHLLNPLIGLTVPFRPTFLTEMEIRKWQVN